MLPRLRLKFRYDRPTRRPPGPLAEVRQATHVRQVTHIRQVTGERQATHVRQVTGERQATRKGWPYYTRSGPSSRI